MGDRRYSGFGLGQTTAKCSSTAGSITAETANGTISQGFPAVIHQWFPPTNELIATAHRAKNVRTGWSSGRLQNATPATSNTSDCRTNDTIESETPNADSVESGTQPSTGVVLFGLRNQIRIQRLLWY